MRSITLTSDSSTGGISSFRLKSISTSISVWLPQCQPLHCDQRLKSGRRGKGNPAVGNLATCESLLTVIIILIRFSDMIRLNLTIVDE
jgi:hypothetical protein